MPAQMRLSATDPRCYSPDRDIAYCSPHLVMRAILGLDVANQEPWVREFFDEQKITEDQLGMAATVLAKYMNTAITTIEYKTPYDALTAVGFFELPKPVQILVCAKLGQIFLSAIFPCVRDVTPLNEAPPYDTKEIARLAAEVMTKSLKAARRPRWLKWLRRLFGWN